MKFYLGFFLLLVAIDTRSQESVEGNLEFLSKFFSDYAPCVEDFYCNQYSISVAKGEMQIGIKTFNYKNGEKFLKETATFVIPLNEIKEVQYFLDNSEDIFIVAKGDYITKTSQGKKELFDSLPLDFNKYKLSKALKIEFERNFNAVINNQ